MFIPLQDQTKSEIYSLLIHAVLPRPIAYITSMNEGGVVNGAPFSFFNVVCSDPAIVSIAIGKKRDGKYKDTARNILNNKEFVIQVVDKDNVKAVNNSAATYPEHISEIAKVGLTLQDSKLISVPRITETKVALECKLYKHIPVGTSESQRNGGTDLILAEVVGIHVDDELFSDGKINTMLLKPIGRLGGTDYTEITNHFSIPRPEIK